MFKWIMILCVAFSASLSAETKVLAFSGSTRNDSVNKKLLLEAASLAKQMGGSVTVLDLKDYPMPFYDGDLEAQKGMSVKTKQFRQMMIQSDVILIASPEYNGSLSATLKNTIDWATRNEEAQGSRDAFKGKKFVIMSASPGSSGGARGLVHLRNIIENIGGTVVTKQIVLANAYGAFDDQGHLKDEAAKNDLKQAMQQAFN